MKKTLLSFIIVLLSLILVSCYNNIEKPHNDDTIDYEDCRRAFMEESILKLSDIVAIASYKETVFDNELNLFVYKFEVNEYLHYKSEQTSNIIEVHHENGNRFSKETEYLLWVFTKKDDYNTLLGTRADGVPLKIFESETPTDELKNIIHRCINSDYRKENHQLEYDWSPKVYVGMTKDDFINFVKELLSNPEPTWKLIEQYEKKIGF